MATRSQSRETNHNGPRKRPSRRLQPKPEEPVDDSAWIHRDKLAAIEIQEMEDAGMHVRQPYRSDSVGQTGRTTRSSSRSMSRNGVRKAQSKDMLADEEYINNQDEYEKKRVSTIQAAEEEEYYDQEYDPRYQADPRAEEEYPYNKGHAVRPSTSRIPISKAAAASSEALDGAPRSRSGSGAPSSWEDMKRMRSGSQGSGILLDDVERTSPEREQPKKTTPRKPPTRSASTQRPGSSSGTKRPSTSHRPEGEAPWIATMYKPDPRLPPDQQMLPTHAKRMMQEQWEREGKLGSTYDRDFNLLDSEEIQPPEKPVVVVQPPVIEDKENVPPPPVKDTAKEWPLTQERANGNASPRPGTANGGYRITPTINTHSPTFRQPSPKPVELAATEKPPTRLPDYNEKDDREPKKGCCCVVM